MLERTFVDLRDEKPQPTRQLRPHHVSVETSSDLAYADHAVATQAQKVGAAIVLLKPRFYGTVTSCCAPDVSFVASSGGGASYFASYGAKPDAHEGSSRIVHRTATGFFLTHSARRNTTAHPQPFLKAEVRISDSALAVSR